MMENKEFIIDTLLNTEDNVNFMLNAQLATEIAMELLGCGIEFVEGRDMYELIKDNEILSVAKNVYNDGEKEYFFQPVLSESGVTLADESDYIFIESDLLEIIDETRLSGQVIELSDEEDEYDLSEDCLGLCNDCECDSDCNCDDECCEDTEVEEPFADYLESKIEQFETILAEESSKKDFCFHCELKHMLISVFFDGYENGKESVTEELENLLDRITE